MRISQLIYEYILESYKISIQKCNNYLTNDGIIDFKNFKIFIEELSLREKEYFNIKYDFLRIVANSKKYHTKHTLIEIYNDEINNNKDLQNTDNTYDKLKKVMNSNEKIK